MIILGKTNSITCNCFNKTDAYSAILYFEWPRIKKMCFTNLQVTIIRLSFLIYNNGNIKIKSMVTKLKGIGSDKISCRFLYVRYCRVWFRLYDRQCLGSTLRWAEGFWI